MDFLPQKRGLIREGGGGGLCNGFTVFGLFGRDNNSSSMMIYNVLLHL